MRNKLNIGEFMSRAFSVSHFLAAIFLAAFLANAFFATPAALANKKYAAIVVDANDGKILHSRSAHSPRYPASLTKMMTLYLIFEDLQKGKISKTTKLTVSKKAANRPASKLWLLPGAKISVEDAIKALVAKSANDVATAVGENLNGSQKEFAKRMTKKARQLGMKNTTFKNANGLTQTGQITTAADMAVLGLALRKHFPQYYHYFDTRVFKYGKNKMKNHNKLLGKVKGIDGIKTGYTSASGFNLVTSIEDEGKSMVAVVMGGSSSGSRDRQMKKLVKEFLAVASKEAPKPVYISLPKVVPVPTNSPKVAGKKIVLPSKRKQEKSSIALKIEQAHAASIGTAQNVDLIDETLKFAWAEQVKVANKELNKSEGLAAIENNTSWQIQITASNSREGAENLLKKARAENKKLLTNIGEITVPLTLKSGKKVFRARFTGFTTEQKAKNTCAALIKNKYKCMLIKL